MDQQKQVPPPLSCIGCAPCPCGAGTYNYSWLGSFSFWETVDVEQFSINGFSCGRVICLTCGLVSLMFTLGGQGFKAPDPIQWRIPVGYVRHGAEVSNE